MSTVVPWLFRGQGFVQTIVQGDHRSWTGWECHRPAGQRPAVAPPNITVNHGGHQVSVPDLFTVTEVAAILRIGRTAAYELAARDLATGGGEGLGVVRVGRQLRIRRAALEMLVVGALSWPVDVESVEVGILVPVTVVPLTVVRSPGERPRVEPWSEPSLPFSS